MESMMCVEDNERSMMIVLSRSVCLDGYVGVKCGGCANVNDQDLS